MHTVSTIEDILSIFISWPRKNLKINHSLYMKSRFNNFIRMKLKALVTLPFIQSIFGNT